MIHARRLARVLTEIVAYEIAHSKRVTLRAFRERSYWRRLVNRVAWWFRWWL